MCLGDHFSVENIPENTSIDCNEIHEPFDSFPTEGNSLIRKEPK